MVTNIVYLKQDATDLPIHRPVVLVHVCNNTWKWGAGFVLAVSRKWSEPENVYRSDPPVLGDVKFVLVNERQWVANMVAQFGVRSWANPHPLDLVSLETCLNKVADFAIENNAIVQMPLIGCGLAGGDWASEVEPIVQRTLVSRGIEVRVCSL